MSDLEYNSDSDSENSGSDSENEAVVPIPFRPNPLGKIVGVENESDSDSEGIAPSDDEDDDDVQFGGAVEEIEEGDIHEDSDPEDSDNEDSDNEDSDDEIELNENGEEIVNEKTVAKQGKNVKNKKTAQLIIDDDENEDDDEYDETYLQKFDTEITKNYINDFHPECFIQNYDEIAKLAIVVRNSDNIIIDPNHRTIPFLTKYEKARVLGQRAKQIETGAKPLVKISENIVDSYIIAELELREKKIPFIIRRPLPNGTCEYWYLRDLEMIGF